MRLLSLITALLVLQAADADTVVSAQSAKNRVALLELYTSEGCSSCPPAERWLSALKDAGISYRQIIPLAFHVTYWDYIGWRDPFGSARYDERQRRIAAFNAQRTIYTPQFVLDGDDYRGVSRFSSDIRERVSRQASVDLKISAQNKPPQQLDVMLTASRANNGPGNLDKVDLYLAVYENNLQSQVEDGENEGRLLRHDYVVRQIYGPFEYSLLADKKPVTQRVGVDENWKIPDLNLVAFVQHPQSGEVLQAVQLELEKAE